MKNILLLSFLLFSIYTNVNAQQKTHQLSTHILDVHKGRPAQNVSIELFKQMPNGEWNSIAKEKTNQDGRVGNLLSLSQNNQGLYKLRFYTEPYLKSMKQATIFPYIDVVFNIQNKEHYHIPIVLSGNGYSTYRGS